MNVKKILLLIALLYAFDFKLSAVEGPVISMSDYLKTFTKDQDVTLAVKAALADCKKYKASKLVFDKGTYHFYPDKAIEKYLFISNNDEGLKRISFPLVDFKNFVIDGQGAMLIFHGYVCPFVVIGSSNVELKNFSVNWARTFHSESTIKQIYTDSIDLSFSDKFPYFIKDQLLFFTDSLKVDYPYHSLLEFDVDKKETAFQAIDYYTGSTIQVKDLGASAVRLYVKGIKASKGNVMVFAAGGRHCSAITLMQSTDLKISQLTIFHAGGMGVIAQHCKNVTLSKVKVTPFVGRMISTSADATHFTNCTGLIKLDDCLFENQEDDATNIHGIYSKITDITSNHSFIVKLMHPQQFGQTLFKAGDSIEFVSSTAMHTITKDKILKVVQLNKEYTEIFVNQKLANLPVGRTVIATLSYPEVSITNCTIRNNRARGILLGSRGKTSIINNYFHTPGAAILFEGDALFWFEQAGVRDVRIANNVFENCNYGVWGNALFQVGSGIAENERELNSYNRGIVIEDNIIKKFDPRMVNIYAVKGFIFRRNKITTTQAYPNLFAKTNPFIVTSSKDVMIEP